MAGFFKLMLRVLISPPPVTVEKLLTEDGDFFVTEDGDNFITEES